MIILLLYIYNTYTQPIIIYTIYTYIYRDLPAFTFLIYNESVQQYK
jgi:hypothetical protein